MAEMSDMGKAISQARDEIIARLREVDSRNDPAPTPHALILELARDRNRDPYRAAMMSLIASGVVERTSAWTLRLHPQPA